MAERRFGERGAPRADGDRVDSRAEKCIICKQANEKLRGVGGFDTCRHLVALVSMLHLLHQLNPPFMS